MDEIKSIVFVNHCNMIECTSKCVLLVQCWSLGRIVNELHKNDIFTFKNILVRIKRDNANESILMKLSVLHGGCYYYL